MVDTNPRYYNVVTCDGIQFPGLPILCRPSSDLDNQVLSKAYLDKAEIALGPWLPYQGSIHSTMIVLSQIQDSAGTAYYGACTGRCQTILPIHEQGRPLTIQGHAYFDIPHGGLEGKKAALLCKVLEELDEILGNSMDWERVRQLNPWHLSCLVSSSSLISADTKKLCLETNSTLKRLEILLNSLGHSVLHAIDSQTRLRQERNFQARVLFN